MQNAGYIQARCQPFEIATQPLVALLDALAAEEVGRAYELKQPVEPGSVMRLFFLLCMCAP